MNYFGARLKYLRKQDNLTQLELATALGISKSTISMYENGNREPDFETKEAFADYFNVSIATFFPSSSALESAKNGGSVSARSVTVPVLGDVAAGLPIEAVENIIDYEEIDIALAATGEFFALRLKGDSMEPRMYPGDVVIVRKQDDANTGDTAVVLVNGDSATVKRIKKLDDGSLLLISNNPSYDPRHFSPAEIRDLPVRIIGKVVELRGKF